MISPHDLLNLCWAALPIAFGICDSIVRNSVDFAQAKNHHDILADAMRELGYTVQTHENGQLSFQRGSVNGTYANGQFNTSSSRYSANTFSVDEVKKSFGRQVVKVASKRFGWKIQETKPNTFVLSKRV